VTLLEAEKGLALKIKKSSKLIFKSFSQVFTAGEAFSKNQKSVKVDF
jgi:hypothetical protein